MRRYSLLVVALLFVVSSCSGSGGDDANPFPWMTSAPGTTQGGADTQAAGPEGVPLAEVLPPDESTIIATAAFGEVFDRRLVVRLADAAGSAAAEDVAAAVDGTVSGRIDGFLIVEIELSEAGEEALAAALATLEAHPAVAIVTPSSALRTAQEAVAMPCGPLDSPALQQGDHIDQYSLIGVEDAWRLVRAAGLPLAKPSIGIVDGFGTNQNFHGGWVAQTLHGSVSPYAPPGILDAVLEDGAATFSRVDVFGSNTRTSVTSYLSGVKQLVDPPASATVINLSFGGTSSPEEQALVRRFLQDLAISHPHVLVVAAAGNNAADVANWDPGGLSEPNLVTVGGLNHQGERWVSICTDQAGVQKPCGSNYVGTGGEVTLSVIAQDTFVGFNQDGEPVVQTGTSFAAPQVAAAAAVLQALDPTLTGVQIKQILVASAATQISNPDINERIIDVDPALGGRVLRIDNAVYEVLKTRPGMTQTREELLAKGTLKVRARPADDEPLTYVIRATAPGGGSSTPVEIVATTNSAGGLVPSQPRQTTQDDVVRWRWLFADYGESAQVTLTRTDTGACARVTLTATEPTFAYAGTYEGSFDVFRYEGTGGSWAPSAIFTLVVGNGGNATADGGVRDSATGPGGSGRIDFSFRCEGLVAADGTLTCFGTGYAETYFTWTDGSPDSAEHNDGPLVLTLAIGTDGSLTGSVSEDGQSAGFPVQGHAVSGGPAGLP